LSDPAGEFRGEILRAGGKAQGVDKTPSRHLPSEAMGARHKASLASISHLFLSWAPLPLPCISWPFPFTSSSLPPTLSLLSSPHSLFLLLSASLSAGLFSPDPNPLPLLLLPLLLLLLLLLLVVMLLLLLLVFSPLLGTERHQGIREELADVLNAASLPQRHRRSRRLLAHAPTPPHPT